MDLLIAKHRLPYLREITQAYSAMVDERMGRLTVHVRTPRGLRSEDRTELRVRLEAALGRQVLLAVETEPGLMAGVRVQMGSEVFDGTVRGQLQRLKQGLSSRT